MNTHQLQRPFGAYQPSVSPRKKEEGAAPEHSWWGWQHQCPPHFGAYQLKWWLRRTGQDRRSSATTRHPLRAWTKGKCAAVPQQTWWERFWQKIIPCRSRRVDRRKKRAGTSPSSQSTMD
ncbi:hypothetical protein CAEBREN_21866 [Caenorhabditis brenneri]|uniref:Uncharacterized protein n=1 Tax=Caenorhabditis brenneri TaxID=135651 RepID=G0MDP6_CAEBE|nr:hypothetical protein CAEBREN_21866 [Caenorhabditis brenneri]